MLTVPSSPHSRVADADPTQGPAQPTASASPTLDPAHFTLEGVKDRTGYTLTKLPDTLETVGIYRGNVAFPAQAWANINTPRDRRLFEQAIAAYNTLRPNQKGVYASSEHANAGTLRLNFEGTPYLNSKKTHQFSALLHFSPGEEGAGMVLRALSCQPAVEEDSANIARDPTRYIPPLDTGNCDDFKGIRATSPLKLQAVAHPQGSGLAAQLRNQLRDAQLGNDPAAQFDALDLGGDQPMDVDVENMTGTGDPAPLSEKARGKQRQPDMPERKASSSANNAMASMSSAPTEAGHPITWNAVKKGVETAIDESYDETKYEAVQRRRRQALAECMETLNGMTITTLTRELAPEGGAYDAKSTSYLEHARRLLKESESQGISMEKDTRFVLMRIGEQLFPEYDVSISKNSITLKPISEPQKEVWKEKFQAWMTNKGFGNETTIRAPAVPWVVDQMWKNRKTFEPLFAREEFDRTQYNDENMKDALTSISKEIDSLKKAYTYKAAYRKLVRIIQTGTYEK